MQIERVFDRHRIAARVSGGTVNPRSVNFHLQGPWASGLERLRGLKDELMASLGVADLQLEGGQGQLNVSVPRQYGPPVPLLDLLELQPEISPVTAVLGMSEDDRLMLLDFLAEGVTHVLIAGEPGAGKSGLMRTIALSLAMLNRQSRLQLLFMHPEISGDDLSDLRLLDYLPHMLTTLVTTPEDVNEVLQFLVREMAYRQEQSVDTPTIVVLIDRCVTLLEAGDEAARAALTQLLQSGADAGIHLVLSTRRPGSKVLGKTLRAHLPVRLVGQAADARAARFAAGIGETQAEYLLGQGDFLAIGDGEVTRFQAAYMDDYDLYASVSELHRRRPPALLAQAITTRQHFREGEAAPDTAAEPQPFSFDGESVAWDDDDFDDLEVIE